jgi:hypothetical protein
MVYDGSLLLSCNFSSLARVCVLELEGAVAAVSVSPGEGSLGSEEVDAVGREVESRSALDCGLRRLAFFIIRIESKSGMVYNANFWNGFVKWHIPKHLSRGSRAGFQMWQLLLGVEFFLLRRAAWNAMSSGCASRTTISWLF